MKNIEDIFSKKKVKKESNHQNIRIVIDTREKQSLIATNLFREKVNVDFEKMDIGDYLIGEVVVERKTFSDFINSMISKRLQEQLINLKKYEKNILIIEGELKNSKIHENAIKGMVLSIILDFKIPIIFTKDEKDTADFLIRIAKRLEKEKNRDFSIRHLKNQKNITQQKQFILEGFPGIGPSISKRLLEKFGSLKEIFNSDIEKLKDIEKFDENKIKKFKELLD